MVSARRSWPRLVRCAVLVALMCPAPPATSTVTAASAARPLCVYVSSGRSGEEWTNGVESGLRAGLGDECELRVLHMGALANETRARSGDAAWAGRLLGAVIDRLEPAAVVASGDEAVRQLVLPHLLERELPVVFAGVDWSIEEYGSPPRHVSGVIEVDQIRPMLRAALLQLGEARRALYIGADTPAGRRYDRELRRIGRSLGITVDRILVDRFETWKTAMESSRHYDLAVLGDPDGIVDWNPGRAHLIARAYTKRLSLTNSRALVRHATIGVTKVPEEHGDWAARTVLAVLGGIPTTRIPLVTSRQWTTWVNLDLMSRARITPDRRLLIDARQVGRP